MQRSPEVTIVIPAFNAEEYLEQCLWSVLSQSFEDVEVLVINDGSTDGTLQIAEEYASRDSRITVLDQNNRGVSAARNRGLHMARGNWIMFVDSDDAINHPELIKMIVTAGDGGAELATFGTGDQQNWSRLNEFDGPSQRNSLGLSIPEVDAGAFRNIRLTSKTISKMIAGETVNAIWDKAFRRSVIRELDLQFCDAIGIAEDLLFNITYLRSVREIVEIDVDGYFYRRDNPQSITRKYRFEKDLELMAVNDRLQSWAVEDRTGRIAAAADYIRAKNIVSCIRDLHHPECPIPRHERVGVAKKHKALAPRVSVAGLGLKHRLFAAAYNVAGPALLYCLTLLISVSMKWRVR